MKLVFATNNQHKLHEVTSLTGNHIEIVCLADIGCTEDIPETAATIEGNAAQKANYIFNKYAIDCFADDTGLEVEALNGRPGVYSARYAGEGCSFEDNIDKILLELHGIKNRNACFRTVISLIINGIKYQFEGRVDGVLLHERRGEKGFGYDPIFLPLGSDRTFAEMPLDLKNKISHRGIAVRKLVEFLRKI
jgi:XTP/dITP diphosphohydrolase